MASLKSGSYVFVIFFLAIFGRIESLVQQTQTITSTASGHGLKVNILNDLGPTVSRVVFGSQLSFQITYWAQDSATLTTLMNSQPSTSTIQGNNVYLSLVGGGNIPMSTLGAWCPDARPWSYNSPKIVCEPYRFTPSPSYSPSSGPSIGAVMIVTVPESTVFCVNYWCASAHQSPVTREIYAPNLQDLGNGIVYNSFDGMMWQQIPANTSYYYDTDFTHIIPVDNYCLNLRLGGYSDWHIPTRMDYFRVLDFRTARPAINTTVFPNVGGIIDSGNWWTQSRDKASDYEGDWYAFNGLDGSVAYNGDVGNSVPNRVRCIRTVINKFTDMDRYMNPSANRATDRWSGLQWTIAYSTGSWDRNDHNIHAPLYCQNLRTDGFSDWRLPTNIEFNSFVQEGLGGVNPMWNYTVFPITTNVDWWANLNIDAAYGDDFWWVWSGVTFPFSSGTAAARCVRGPDFTVAGGSLPSGVAYSFPSGAATTKALTTNRAITSNPLTTRELTTSRQTTRAVTTSPLTTRAVTSNPLTTSPLTTRAVTSNPLTTSPLTTRAVTSNPLTTSHQTTGAITSGPLTTSPLTTRALSTSLITSGSSSVRSGSVTSGSRRASASLGMTSGAVSPVTTDGNTQISTSMSPATTGDESTSAYTPMTTRDMPVTSDQTRATTKAVTSASRATSSLLTSGYMSTTRGRLRQLNVTLIHIKLAGSNISSDDFVTAVLTATNLPESSRYRIIIVSDQSVTRDVTTSFYIAPGNNADDADSANLTTALFKTITENPNSALPGYRVTAPPTMSYAVVEVPNSSTTDSDVASSSKDSSFLLGYSLMIVASAIAAIVLILIVIIVAIILIVRKRRNSGTDSVDLITKRERTDANMYLTVPPSGSNPLFKGYGADEAIPMVQLPTPAKPNTPKATLRNENEKFRVGATCEAKWEEDGAYYAATIDDIKGDKYYVTYTDFGEGASLNKSDLR